MTKYPLVLCHGLFGFDTLSSPIPLIIKDQSYWHGIKETLQAKGATVLTGSVAPAGSIAERAQMLADSLYLKLVKNRHEQLDGSTAAVETVSKDPAPATSATDPVFVNIIGHSMGGLDARYMISNLDMRGIKPVSLTTVATPHHGSYFADFVVDRILSKQAQRLLLKFGPAFGVNSLEGIHQLTRQYLNSEFNPKCPDDPSVLYMSYGARFRPGITSTLRYPWKKIKRAEGDNDGLVSVQSAQWGNYMGTIDDCDHLDVINLRGINSWLDLPPLRSTHDFNAMALYLEIMDNLAEKGF